MYLKSNTSRHNHSVAEVKRFHDISGYEADRYFIEIAEYPYEGAVPKKPDVILTLTREDAIKLRDDLTRIMEII